MNSHAKKGNVYQCPDKIPRYTPKELFDIFYDINEIAVVQVLSDEWLVNYLTKRDLFNIGWGNFKPGKVRDVIYYSRKEDGVQHLDRFYDYIDKIDPDLSVKVSDEFIANAIKSRAEKLGVNIMCLLSRQIIRERDDDKELIDRVIGVE